MYQEKARDLSHSTDKGKKVPTHRPSPHAHAHKVKVERTSKEAGNIDKPFG